MGLRVLVVEDEALLAMLVEEYLDELGCEVAGVAMRLDEALEQARTLAVDVAVLDVNLAGQASYVVAEVLRERGVPVVFATGYGAAGLPENLKGTPLLPKPFQCEQLADALSAACGGWPASSVTAMRPASHDAARDEADERGAGAPGAGERDRLRHRHR